MYRKYFKRLLDLLFSILLLLLLLLIGVIIAMLSKIHTGKIFYLQRRDGKDKKSFTMYKFCSMKEINGNYMERTTKVTRVLRSLGLDELPQLFNILKGDMSFVGPRPFITGEELPTEPGSKIYTVRPGVVSLATANGRRKITHEMRLKYDEEYVDNVTFKQDVIILFKTLGVLIKQNVRGDVWNK